MSVWARLRHLLQQATGGNGTLRDLAARQQQLKTDVEMTKREAERMARFWHGLR